ncbi:hypothetical protein PRIPAC_74187 [Pristionchus pacificus]|uniref:Uncharacterized protein n=1 Tax=Pristionchus pacificus TaxID=54126 RepID=A0A454XPF9_PRIPA|nr:hypothetical protein PRIPAC_74187 [Pristionchus pacificus]|eukprot:PDM81320.1 hypothetical protein PRIPAC_36323 [Pristionchus pacificus]
MNFVVFILILAVLSPVNGFFWCWWWLPRIGFNIDWQITVGRPRPRPVVVVPPPPPPSPPLPAYKRYRGPGPKPN